MGVLPRPGHRDHRARHQLHGRRPPGRPGSKGHDMTEALADPVQRRAGVGDVLLLDVRDLRTYFHVMDGTVKAVDGVSFSIRRGGRLALVGESGCGKSVTAMSIMRLIDIPPGEIASGEILFDGVDLLKLGDKAMRQVRGRRHRDDLPGADDQPQPGVHGGRSDRRGGPPPSDREQEGGEGDRLAVAGRRRSPRPQAPVEAVSPRAVGRDAPAHHDRHGPQL